MWLKLLIRILVYKCGLIFAYVGRIGRMLSEFSIVEPNVHTDSDMLPRFGIRTSQMQLGSKTEPNFGLYNHL